MPPGNPVLTTAPRAEQSSAEATPLSHCIAETNGVSDDMGGLSEEPMQIKNEYWQYSELHFT
jgi:hypothetical protein